MGVMQSAGGSLRWFRDTLCKSEIKEAENTRQDVYQLIVEQAERVPAGSENLIFLPYLSGERHPHSDAKARGISQERYGHLPPEQKAILLAPNQWKTAFLFSVR